jgi:hypothetical protein
VQVAADFAGTGVVLHFRVKSKPANFLQKSFLDPQYIISSLNRWGKKGIRTAWARTGVFGRCHFMWVSNRA